MSSRADTSGWQRFGFGYCKHCLTTILVVWSGLDFGMELDAAFGPLLALTLNRHGDEWLKMAFFCAA